MTFHVSIIELSLVFLAQQLADHHDLSEITKSPDEWYRGANPRVGFDYCCAADTTNRTETTTSTLDSKEEDTATCMTSSNVKL